MPIKVADEDDDSTKTIFVGLLCSLCNKFHGYQKLAKGSNLKTRLVFLHTLEDFRYAEDFLLLQLISRWLRSSGENCYFGGWTVCHYTMLRFLSSPNPVHLRLHPYILQVFSNLELATLSPSNVVPWFHLSSHTNMKSFYPSMFKPLLKIPCCFKGQKSLLWITGVNRRNY